MKPRSSVYSPKNENKDRTGVLLVNAGSEKFGGVSAFSFNLFMHTDHDRYAFGFLSPNKTTYGIVRKEIEENGGNIHELGVTGSFPVRTCRLYRRMVSFLQENDYDIVHINSGSVFFNYVVSRAVRKAGKGKVIVHSHNSLDEDANPLRDRIFQELRKKIEKNADVLLACSKKAAEFMFTEKALHEGRVKVVYNGIDTERFTYDENDREKTRNELQMHDRYIIGTAGRLTNAKNQRFLIDVIEQAKKLDSNAALVIYGEGELHEALQKAIDEKGLQNDVLIHEPVADIETVYPAMDVFVLPSLYEGFPLTILEAQCEGLPVVLSDAITEEVKICDNVVYMPLSDPAETWAECLLKNNEKDPLGKQKMKDAGLDIESTAKTITGIYDTMMKE